MPVLGRVRNIRQMIAEGDMLLLDTSEESLFVRPTQAMQEAFEAKLELSQKRRAAFAQMRGVAPVTTDGHRVTVMVNAGLRDDMAALDLTGADGIGLFRTEFQFLVSATLPQREMQRRLYKDVLDAAGTAPLPSAPSISAATRRCPISTMTRMARKRIPPWAGGRCASRSIATG